jgi:hypothetical protein
LLDKKTFVLAVAVSWVLTLVTVLLLTNFLPSLGTSNNQQYVSITGSQIVNLEKQGIIELEDWGGVWVKHLNFTWSPGNKKNNAILGILGSFEYNVEIEQSGLDVDIVINRFQGYIGSDLLLDNTKGEWKSTSFLIRHTGGNWIKTNQDVYPIQLQLSVPNNRTHIRNVKLILLVVDE